MGREDETAEVIRLLGQTRLLTLTGAGGTGKSRLALHVADELLGGYRDGAFFADLSTVTDPGLVPSALARALGVPEAAGRPVLEALGDHLRDKELLLVVDNFEQVAGAGPVLEELLGAAPRIRVLVTSRSRWPSGASRSWWCHRWSCPTPGGSPTSRPSAGPRRCGCSSSGPRRCGPGSG